MQEWLNLAWDNVWRLRKTPPLVSFLVGWLVYTPHSSHEGGRNMFLRNVGILHGITTQKTTVNRRQNLKFYNINMDFRDTVSYAFRMRPSQMSA
jgi:hypothetical protein